MYVPNGDDYNEICSRHCPLVWSLSVCIFFRSLPTSHSRSRTLPRFLTRSPCVTDPKKRAPPQKALKKPKIKRYAPSPHLHDIRSLSLSLSLKALQQPLFASASHTVRSPCLSLSTTHFICPTALTLFSLSLSPTQTPTHNTHSLSHLLRTLTCTDSL